MLKHIMDEAGQTILEFAVILPVFVFVGFGLVDILWMVKTGSNIEYISTEVARCEALHEINPPAPLPCNAANAGVAPKEYAKRLASTLRLSTGPELTIDTPPCDPAAGKCDVTLTYQYRPIGVWFPALTMNRKGTASYVPPAPAP